MVVLAVVLSAACSSSKDPGGLVDPSPPPPTALPSATSFSVTGATVESVAQPPPPFPDDVKAAVRATLDRYLQDAVLTPLRTGQRAGDLGPIFTGPARARVDGADRAALVDEGLPPAADVRADAATVGLAALAGGDSAVTVVTAALDLRVQTGGSDPVTIVRGGHLVLVPDGGGWKIDGYDVRTTRDSAGGATTTTAHG